MSLFNYRRLFMAELSRNMLRLKRVMNKFKNRNTRFVNVRSVRNCRYCGKQIGVGDECLTTNKKLEGRRWACLDSTEYFKTFLKYLLTNLFDDAII